MGCQNPFGSEYWLQEYTDTIAEIKELKYTLSVNEAENDKDRIVLNRDRLKNLLDLSREYYRNYKEACEVENGNEEYADGIEFLPRCDYGY